MNKKIDRHDTTRVEEESLFFLKLYQHLVKEGEKHNE